MCDSFPYFLLVFNLASVQCGVTIVFLIFFCVPFMGNTLYCHHKSLCALGDWGIS